jgi:hypothetical protein
MRIWLLAADSQSGLGLDKTSHVSHLDAAQVH